MNVIDNKLKNLIKDVNLNRHASKRLQERFGINKSWLINELRKGKFVWLNGAGNNGNIKKLGMGI